jgi:uncharacterized membrane protein YqjE
VHNEKPLGTVISETKEELKDFIQTRIAILKAELKEKMSTWKYCVPMLIGAVLLLLGGWAVVTFALVALVAGMFQPSAYAWCLGGLIIGGIYLLGGIAVGWFAYSELMSAGIAPTRTIEVLKQDQVWIQSEARTA